MVEPCMTIRLQAETWKFCSGRARELAEDPNIQIKWRNGQCLLTMIGTVAYIQKLLPEWWKHVRIYSTNCKKYWTSYTRLKKICWPEWITNLMVHCKNAWGKLIFNIEHSIGIIIFNLRQIVIKKQSYGFLSQTC